MHVGEAIHIPHQVLEYLRGHHVITIGTASFTGMPHAATTAYASDHSGLYFSMSADEITIRNAVANHYASFTIDDYTPDFRKVRELRGVGVVVPVNDPEVEKLACAALEEKFAGFGPDWVSDLHHIQPLELHFVDFEYTEGIAIPHETSLVYQAAAVTSQAPEPVSTQLESLVFESDDILVRQGESADKLFIVIEGEVEMRREGHGQDVIVTRHGPGSFLGEPGALSGAKQTATLTAVTRTVVLAIDQRAMRDLASQSAGAELGQRVRQTLTDLERDAAQD